MVKLIVFVPGFMGSSLLHRGPSESRNIVERPAWGQDLAQTVANFRYLMYPTRSPASMTAVSVVDHVSLYGAPFFGSEVYGILVRHLQGLARKRKCRLITFPYDWRASVLTTSLQLAEQLETERAHLKDGELAVVAHSMGGLVARLAILQKPHLVSTLGRFVQIATPVRGSVKAMRTLAVAPAMGTGFDGLLRTLLSLVDIGRSIRQGASIAVTMMDVIRSFPSLYELLPPDDVLPLVDSTGRRHSCLEEQLWSTGASGLVAAARHTHREIAKTASLSLPIQVLYAKAVATENGYRVAHLSPPDLGLVFDRDSSDGDGTVTVDSATHTAPPDVLKPQNEEPRSHMPMCRNLRLLRQLDAAIA